MVEGHRDRRRRVVCRMPATPAVVTATDGKVRAFAVDSGERQWIYEAKSPLFAAVAIARTSCMPAT